MNNVIICGPIKNCAPFLHKILSNMNEIGLLFNDYKILLYYDKSLDNSLEIIKNHQKTNSKILCYENKEPLLKYRTHNLAKARNFCLNYIMKNRENYNYFIMMDTDDVNCKSLNKNVLKKYLNNDEKYQWDALSFNSSPEYYDIWGLSIYPFCYSYNHFKNNEIYHNVIKNYIMKLLDKSKKENKLLNCISSFNGFSIYKTNKFINCFYDGRPRLDLIPKEYIYIHSKIINSNLVFKKYNINNNYPFIDSKYEDCEHRIFHILASLYNGAKIMISPEIVFY